MNTLWPIGYNNSRFMENTESAKSEVSTPAETPARISRRSFLKKVGVMAGGALVAGSGVGLALDRFGVFKKDLEPPTFNDVVSAVDHAYKSTEQEVPEEISKRLPSCNEQTTTHDPIKEVLESCGEVGGGIRDLVKNTKDPVVRNGLIEDLKTVERYTMAKIDEYANGSKLGKLPDPENIDGLKLQLKETYFSLPPKE